MEKMVKIKFEDGSVIEVKYKTKIVDAINMAKKDVSDVLGVKVNNEVRTFNYELVVDSKIEFIKFKSTEGYRIYSRTLKMILYMALTSLYSNASVEFIATINRDQYFMTKNIELTPNKIIKIKEKMKEIIAKNLPITKRSVPIEEARLLYTESNNLDKLSNISNKLSSNVSMYFCDGMYNNFHGALAPYTGLADVFDLLLYKGGAILVIPDEDMNIKKEIKEERLYDSYIEFNHLNDILEIKDVSNLNDKILKNKSMDIIQVSEAIHQKEMVKLALDVETRENIKMILIAGPSSSGKTTFAQKLGVQLKLIGLNPVTISMDNYFVERENTPLGEDGKYNFECVEALDVELFNNQMKDLIDGKTVELPEFDFLVGKKKYNGKLLKLNKNDVLIIEGIHALNPVLTKFTPDENKYKVYISPVATLNLDGYTKISSSDTRLLRRMVRDYATRGHSIERTFELWINVKKGEEKYIFPFVNTVDYIYNSSLTYEPSVMKIFAQPLLLQIDEKSEYYSEARRLYVYLNNFLPMETGSIPTDSIIREFIGNGCFYR